MYLFSFLAYFPAHRQTEPTVAREPSRLAVAGGWPCWVDRVVRTSKQKLVDEGV